MGTVSSFLRRVRAVLGRREGAPPATDGLRIRPMRPGDLRTVVALENASFGAPWRPSAYSRAVADPHHNFFVAEFDGDLDVPNESFPIQRAHNWFARETLEALARLRGIERDPAEGYSEAFYCRKPHVTF